MLALKDLGEEAKQYQAVMEKHATENMNAVAKCLLEMASAADTRCSGIVEKQCQSNFCCRGTYRGFMLVPPFGLAFGQNLSTKLFRKTHNNPLKFCRVVVLYLREYQVLKKR